MLFCVFLLSPPTRGCELKYIRQRDLLSKAGSPPTRGCELKYKPVHVQGLLMVTPHAGVRIEIYVMLYTASHTHVTPHAGVRIEI